MITAATLAQHRAESALFRIRYAYQGALCRLSIGRVRLLLCGKGGGAM